KREQGPAMVGPVIGSARCQPMIASQRWTDGTRSEGVHGDVHAVDGKRLPVIPRCLWIRRGGNPRTRQRTVNRCVKDAGPRLDGNVTHTNTNALPPPASTHLSASQDGVPM